MNLIVSNRTFSKGWIIIVSLFCLTFLRPLLILCYPFILWWLIEVYNFKLSKSYLLFFIVLLLLSFISMISEGFFLFNYLMGTYLVLTPIVILSLNVRPRKKKYSDNLFNLFIRVFTVILAIVNVSAVFYALYALWSTEYPDDVFTGLYGRSGFGSHTLSIINLSVSVYYLFEKKYKKFILFIGCGVLGFYGLGLLIFLLAIVVFYSPLIIKNIGIVFKGLIILALVFFITYIINPGNVDYIKVNVRDSMSVFESYDYEVEMDKINNYQRTFTPRYYTFLQGTGRLIMSDAKVFLLGTSPGTYNSRTAFYLNGDFIQNQFIKDNFSENTYYHEEYVKPILNRKLISVPWNDGTRNQPFSSLISIFLEYGVLLGLLIVLICRTKIRDIWSKTNRDNKRKYVQFLALFLFLLLLVQNYLEYPEIIIFFLMVFKLIELDNSYEEFTSHQ